MPEEVKEQPRPTHFRVTGGGLTLGDDFKPADTILSIDELGSAVDFFVDNRSVVEASTDEIEKYKEEKAKASVSTSPVVAPPAVKPTRPRPTEG